MTKQRAVWLIAVAVRPCAPPCEARQKNRNVAPSLAQAPHSALHVPTQRYMYSSQVPASADSLAAAAAATFEGCEHTGREA